MLPFPLPGLRGTVRARLVLGGLLVMIPTSILFGLWGIQNQREVLLDTMDRHGRSLAAVTAITCVEPLLERDYPILESTVQSLTAEKDDVVFVRIEDESGRVVAPAGTDGNYPGDPGSTKVHTAPIEIFDGGHSETIGRVVLGLSTARAAEASLESQRMRTVETASLFLALAGALWFLLHSLVGRPLRILDADARRLADADLSQPIRLSGDDEFGRLAAALEKMRTNLRTSYREIKQQNEHLRELDQVKSEFLATMSHEIRTPMNGVLGFARELLDTDLDQNQREMIHTVVGSAEELLLLLNDILDFSRLEASKLNLDRVPTDLRRVVEDVGKLAEPTAREKGLEVRVEFDPAIPPAVISDRHRLRQVLSNLTMNAVKFTHSGHVTLRVQRVADDEHPHRVRFEVVDTGIGVPEDKVGLLFEPFRQVDGSHARKFGGSGLGLSISTRLVTLMGGQIQVESEVGSGSRFWFELELPATNEKPSRPSWETSEQPRRRPAPTPPADDATDGATDGAKPPPARPANPRTRVLLAEDNLTNQKLIKHVLGKLGTDVTVADDGHQVVDAFLNDPDGWDLILMDCQMPAMDGFEATAEIRAREPEGSRTPIIALTANAMVGDRERCLGAGMDDYLTKPLLTEELRAVLTRWSRPRA